MIVPEVYAWFDNIHYRYFNDTRNDLIGHYSMIGHWFFSWKNNGWKPILLTPLDLTLDDEVKNAIRLMKNFPTGSQFPPYSFTTILRWFAWNQHFCPVDPNRYAFFVDYDVINYGLKPDNPELQQFFNNPFTSFLTSWGAIISNKEGLRMLTRAMSVDFDPDRFIGQREENNPMTSDQHIGRSIAPVHYQECDVNCVTKNLRHFGIIYMLSKFSEEELKDRQYRDRMLRKIFKIEQEEDLHIPHKTIYDIMQTIWNT